MAERPKVSGSDRNEQNLTFEKRKSIDELGRNLEKGMKIGQSASSPADWRSLFAASEDQTLRFFPPQSSNGKIRIVPPVEVFDEGEKVWKNAIVAQFVGRLPNFGAFQKLVNNLWGDEGEVDIRPVGLNLFIIQFPNSEKRDKILENGPWHIHNKPLIVRKWEPGLRSLEFNMAKLPIWIHLANIPLELFTQQGISYIASGLGNPLYMDRITARQQRLAFAKVCVEIDAGMEIPKFLEVELRNGSLVHVQVDIPWMPIKCSQCKIFGHADKACSLKVVKEVAVVWVPKKQTKNADKVIELTMQENEDKGFEIVKSGKKNDKSTDIEDVSTSTPLKSGSTNRFEILSTEEQMVEEVVAEPRNEEAVLTEPKKTRAASVGVAELMNTLKPRKKGPIDKGELLSLPPLFNCIKFIGKLCVVKEKYIIKTEKEVT